MSGNQPGQEPRGEIRDSIIQTVYSSVIKSQTENLPKSWEIGHTCLLYTSDGADDPRVV